jgi:Ni,Fe-hydrogenase I small subunit
MLAPADLENRFHNIRADLRSANKILSQKGAPPANTSAWYLVQALEALTDTVEEMAKSSNAHFVDDPTQTS